MTAREDFACVEAREAVHATLDAEPLDAALKQRLEAHLASCSACREFAEELRAAQRELRALPELELPQAALEEVWERTSRAGRAGESAPWGRYLPAAAAAAAVVLFGGLWLLRPPAREPAGPTEAELRRAAIEARMVLRIASDALRKSERAAFREVLTDEVSEALRRAPIRWPERSAAERRGS